VAYEGSSDDWTPGRSCTLDTGMSAADVNGENLHGLTAQCAMNLIVDNKYTDTTYMTDKQYMNTLPACSKSSQAPSDPAHRFYDQATNSSLEQVFTQIAEQATQPRLVSNNAS